MHAPTRAHARADGRLAMHVPVHVYVHVRVHVHVHVRVYVHAQACQLLRALVGLQTARGAKATEQLWSLSLLAEAARGTNDVLARWAGRRLAAAERRQRSEAATIGVVGGDAEEEDEEEEAPAAGTEEAEAEAEAEAEVEAEAEAVAEEVEGAEVVDAANVAARLQPALR